MVLHQARTRFMEILPDGSVITIVIAGDDSGHPEFQSALMFNFAFTLEEFGYESGIFLEDRHGSDGTALFFMNPSLELTKISDNYVPEGRTDMDIEGFETAPTQRYGGLLTIADHDENDDHVSVIYQLTPELEWIELTEPAHTNDREYRDISFSAKGSFGDTLYAADQKEDVIYTIQPDGSHQVFASGFSNIESISVSADGEDMYVSDENGVYRIFSSARQAGPTLIMREPWVMPDDVHSGPSGVKTLRLLWSEKIQFDRDDLSISNQDGAAVPFLVTGSQTQFMLITFGETLLNDEYTIVIHDSVSSVETGAAIDGDEDNEAGGDAVLVMAHRLGSGDDNPPPVSDDLVVIYDDGFTLESKQSVPGMWLLEEGAGPLINQNGDVFIARADGSEETNGISQIVRFSADETYEVFLELPVPSPSEQIVNLFWIAEDTMGIIVGPPLNEPGVNPEYTLIRIQGSFGALNVSNWGIH